MPPVTLRLLETAADAAPFVPLTHVSVRLGLKRLAPGLPLVAVGAEARGEAVGLAVVGRSGDEAHVLWLYVRPGARQRGVGGRLLERAEAEAGDAARLVARWLDDRPSTPAILRLLGASGWTDPRHRATVYRTHDEDAARFGRLPWIVDTPLRPSYGLFPWATLGTDERRLIEQDSQNGELSAAPHFNPFDAGRFPVDAATSVGIRVGGRVVGWMITRAMAPGVTLMDRMWAEPEHQRSGAAAAALGASLAVVYDRDRHTPGWGCVWVTMADNRPMMAFNARRLAPHATRVSRQVESAKARA